MWLRPADSKKFCAQIELFRAVECEASPLLTAASARYSSLLFKLGRVGPVSHSVLVDLSWEWCCGYFIFSSYFSPFFFPSVFISPFCASNPRDATCPTTTSAEHDHPHTPTHSHKAKVMTAAGPERREGKYFL
jgi:hypothetical protein